MVLFKISELIAVGGVLREGVMSSYKSRTEWNEAVKWTGSETAAESVV